ncbi:glycerol-3-phosphate 1-O-acyltransferase PlsY [Candidatus Bipolaricaulota bacterium]|nr:glycerol-3-phosphate 1-O-acyltransferase PlsY [Candidatus Bipolaricaulota bacterium]
MSGSLALLLLASLASYLLGAIPFSFIVPKVFLNTDIRQHGSGNPGASNVSRVCGKSYGALALILDVGKGILAVFLVQQLALPLPIGFLAVLGHVFNPFLSFSGGKGVATSLGVVSFASWPAGLVFAVIWVLFFSTWNIAGLSSLVAISSVPVVFYVFRGPGFLLWVSLALVSLIFFTHRGNIVRLIRGEERKV